MSVGDDGHGLGKLRAPGRHGRVDEPDTPSSNRVTDGQARTDVGSARADEDDSPGPQLRDVHGRADGCHRQPDADGSGCDEECANPG